MLLTTIWISIVAGIISLDVTACWQVMISRPIIIGPVIGYLCGDFSHGIITGALLELIWINTLPLGASIPLDAAATTVVATASAIFMERWWTGTEPAAIAIGLAYALPLGVIFKRLDIFIRRFSNNLVYYADEYAKEGRMLRIQSMVLLAIILIFVKYFLFYFISIYCSLYILHAVVPYLPDTLIAGLNQSWILLIALGLAMVLDTFMFKKMSKENE
jgi:mannose/fructose/N-acetylgalactosamine-specific phosphotransferase system component IIC